MKANDPGLDAAYSRARCGAPAARSPALIGAAVAILATAVSGAERPAGALAIEEVTVTARKVEESLQTTPVAVSAFTGADLEVRNAIDVVDVARASPNVHLESGSAFSGASTTPTVFIRGLGQSDFLITSDPAVGVYLDGVYVARTIGSLVDLVDLERVEVLRGPQGTLFGRNTIGGAINLISRRPHEGREGSAALTVGEDDWYEGKLAVNAPINERLFTRLSGFVRKRDGFVDAAQYDDLELGEDDVWGVRGQVRWLATDMLTVDVSVDYTQEREAPAAWYAAAINEGEFRSPVDGALFNAATGDPSCLSESGRSANAACYGSFYRGSKFVNHSVWVDSAGNRIEPENQTDIIGIAVDVVWDLPFATFKSLSAYRSMDAEFFNDLDFTPHLVFHNNNVNFDDQQYSQEFQLDGSAFDNRLDWVTGIYLFQEEGEENVDVIRHLASVLGLPTAPLMVDDSRKIRNSSVAWFGQATWHLMDRWHLTLGARFTRDEKKYTQQALVANAGRRLAGEQSANEWTPMASLAYDLTDEVMLYVSYSEGFRDGGFPPRTIGAITAIPSFDPEFVEVVEGGIKSTWFNDRLRANLAVFSTDYSDIQVAAVPQNASPAQAVLGVNNLAAATIFGFELEANALVTQNLRLDLALGYLGAEIDEVVNDRLLSEGFVVTADNELPYTPEWTWNLGLSHHLPLPNGGEIFSRFDWMFTDEQFYRVENPAATFQDAYSQVNAAVSYRHPGERWEATLGVRNLLDEEFASTATFLVNPAGTAQRTVSRPRTVFATLRYRWGD